MKTFKDVPQSMILQLLDKRVKKTSVQVDATSETHIAPSLGIFVHGLEDEFELVRLATLGTFPMMIFCTAH